MSLEDQIAKLTAAVEANTKALGGAATKPAAGKPAGKPAAGAKKPAAKKATTADDIAEAFGSYLKTGDKDERDAARANVKAIISAMDVARITELEADRFDEALGYLKQFENGEDPFEGGEAEGDDDLM